MTLKHPAQNALNARFHRHGHFFARLLWSLKLALAHRAGNHTGLIGHLHCWVLATPAAAILATTIWTTKLQSGDCGFSTKFYRSCRRSHLGGGWPGSAQSLPRSKLAYRRSFQAHFVVDMKQRFHYTETETFMFETSTG